MSRCKRFVLVGDEDCDMKEWKGGLCDCKEGSEKPSRR